jgi:hypothetical protein
MDLGGTIETLDTALQIANDWGGTDTITHRAWGFHLDPFTRLVGVEVQVVLRHGSPTSEKAFVSYPGIAMQIATFTQQELTDLDTAGNYTLLGLIDAAKTKLGLAAVQAVVVNGEGTPE